MNNKQWRYEPQHSSFAKPPTRKDPLFLHVRAGVSVVTLEAENWWMGDVIYEEGGARDSKVPTLLHAACVDKG